MSKYDHDYILSRIFDSAQCWFADGAILDEPTYPLGYILSKFCWFAEQAGYSDKQIGDYLGEHFSEYAEYSLEAHKTSNRHYLNPRGTA